MTANLDADSRTFAGEAHVRKPVLFVLDAEFNSLGGAERQAIVLAEALRAQGVTVEFVYACTDRTLPAHEDFRGFSLHRVFYREIKLLGALHLMWVFAWFVLKRRHRYAYFHVHVTKLMAATLGLMRPWLGIPVVAKVSGHYEFTGGILDRRRRFHPLLGPLRLLTKRVDYMHAISQYTQDILRENGFRPSQILAIPNAVDLTRFSAPTKTTTETVRVGFCGRIEAVKGLDVLLDALFDLPAVDGKPVTLDIAGVGDVVADLEAQVAQLSLQERVRFLGEVTDVPAFLNTLDIYVQPSYAEGLPNSVLEAMSASLPVVASDISGNQDLVEEGVTGFLFPAGDRDALRDKLGRMLSDADGRWSMGRKGREKMEQHYSTDIVARQFAKLYYANQT